MQTFSRWEIIVLPNVFTGSVELAIVQSPSRHSTSKGRSRREGVAKPQRNLAATDASKRHTQYPGDRVHLPIAHTNSSHNDKSPRPVMWVRDYKSDCGAEPRGPPVTLSQSEGLT